jgi:hypothetical protein
MTWWGWFIAGMIVANLMNGERAYKIGYEAGSRLRALFITQSQ